MSSGLNGGVDEINYLQKLPFSSRLASHFAPSLDQVSFGPTVDQFGNFLIFTSLGT